MQHLVYDQYAPLSLSGLLQKLENNYLDSLEHKASIILAQVDEVKDLQSNESNELFVTLCEKAVLELLQQVRLRRQVLYPYALQLLHKVADGHNCASCSGGCSANHRGHLKMYQESAEKLKNMLYRLSQLSLMPNGNAHLNRIKLLLPNEIILLDGQCKELFYLEQKVLLPKIEEAQETINAV